MASATLPDHYAPLLAVIISMLAGYCVALFVVVLVFFSFLFSPSLR